MKFVLGKQEIKERCQIEEFRKNCTSCIIPMEI